MQQSFFFKCDFSFKRKFFAGKIWVKLFVPPRKLNSKHRVEVEKVLIKFQAKIKKKFRIQEVIKKGRKIYCHYIRMQETKLKIKINKKIEEKKKAAKNQSKLYIQKWFSLKILFAKYLLLPEFYVAAQFSFIYLFISKQSPNMMSILTLT